MANWKSIFETLLHDNCQKHVKIRCVLSCVLEVWLEGCGGVQMMAFTGKRVCSEPQVKLKNYNVVNC